MNQRDKDGELASENDEAEILSNDDVIDDAAQDNIVSSLKYDITSFGADYDVEGLYRRLERKEILVPEFQRDYVWKLSEASRFIESLLLGLPVPGIFLARESETNRLLVIDGQQRLKTLQFFYNGYFNPKEKEKRRRVFSLQKVDTRFEGKTFTTLDAKDRITLHNSIIHATIIKQDAPADDDTSIYHIFERLNNGGRKLTPQEIRSALYHGSLIDTLAELNNYETWRAIFGLPNSRLKDVELILRFLALYSEHKKYVKPMGEFLNVFSKRRQDASTSVLTKYRNVFQNTIDTLYSAVGEAAFRPDRSINAAVFDSVMVGLAIRTSRQPAPTAQSVRKAYRALLRNPKYIASTSASTSDEKSVASRIRLATQAFKDV